MTGAASASPRWIPPATLGEARRSIAAWVADPVLADLVAAFNGSVPSNVDLKSLLGWLAAFSERWDFRAGRERNLAEDPKYDPATSELILRVAANLGLVGATEPRATRYDHVIVLGGLARACIARPLHAARLMTAGRISAPSVVGLGGYRLLTKPELLLVRQVLEQDVANEFEALDLGMRRAFMLRDPVAEQGEHLELVGASWCVRDYLTSGGVSMRVVAAPSGEVGIRRANTADTYRWFASELASLGSDGRILLITSDIYVPSQHADALRMLALPFGASIDTVGIVPGAIDARLAHPFLPHHYLQEIRSTILAFRNLSDALARTASDEDPSRT